MLWANLVNIKPCIPTLLFVPKIKYETGIRLRICASGGKRFFFKVKTWPSRIATFLFIRQYCVEMYSFFSEEIIIDI